MTRPRLILQCFLSRDCELFFKTYCVYVRTSHTRILFCCLVPSP